MRGQPMDFLRALQARLFGDDEQPDDLSQPSSEDDVQPEYEGEVASEPAEEVTRQSSDEVQPEPADEVTPQSADEVYPESAGEADSAPEAEVPAEAEADVSSDPPPFADAVPGRQERAAGRILDDEGLRGDLTDDEYQPLLDWALAQTDALAAATAALDDEQADTTIEAGLVAIRDALQVAQEAHTAPTLGEETA
ncbi:MAG: hypothetical protein IT306_05260 [Chloroflexi bacterium]|nr:hypothetical protein [Chloroflexota bacterium]